MPNHVHVTIAFCKTKKGINTIVGDGKRFIGYEIVNRLAKKEEAELLLELQNAVNASDKKKGKLHEIWEDSFDWKECNNTMFTFQKLNYMHNNPCTGKWQLSSNPTEYVHSSALFYSSGQQGIYPILNFMELDDIELNKTL